MTEGVGEVPGAVFGRACEAFELRVARLAGVANALGGELVDLVAEALDEGFAQGWGIHSPGHWLAWQMGLAPARAEGIVRLARRRDELPTTMAALRAGEMSLDAAVEIGRLAPASHEVSICEFAQVATVSQLRRVLRSYGFDFDAESDEAKAQERRQVGEHRSVSMGTDDTGWWMRGRLPADEGAVVERAIAAARDDVFRARREDQGAAEQRLGLPAAPPPVVTLADGLLAVAEASLDAGAAAHPGSDRYQVHLHLDASPTAEDPHGVLSVGLGQPIPAALRSLLLCGCDLRPVFEVHGAALSVGRRHRTVTSRMRRIIEHRDRGCRVPGCGRTWGLEVHHLWHWEDGGPTDTPNLICVCRAHHRQHHLGVLGIEGNADLPVGTEGAVQFTDPFGRAMARLGRPTPPDLTSGPIAAAARIGIAAESGAYTHPDGGRLDHSAVTFASNQPPRYGRRSPDPPGEPDPPYNPLIHPADPLQRPRPRWGGLAEAVADREMLDAGYEVAL